MLSSPHLARLHSSVTFTLTSSVPHCPCLPPSTHAQNKTVVIDWYADWCGPCRHFAPTYERISNESAYADSHVFLKANVEEVESDSVDGFPSISSIPSFFVIKDGKVKSMSGADPAKFTQLINA